MQQLGRFADAQEPRIHSAKRSKKGGTIPQRGDFTDAQESVIQVVKRTEKGSAFPQRGLICYYSGMAYSGCKTFSYGNFYTPTGSIC